MWKRLLMTWSFSNYRETTSFLHSPWYHLSSLSLFLNPLDTVFPLSAEYLNQMSFSGPLHWVLPQQVNMSPDNLWPPLCLLPGLSKWHLICRSSWTSVKYHISIYTLLCLFFFFIVPVTIWHGIYIFLFSNLYSFSSTVYSYPRRW